MYVPQDSALEKIESAVRAAPLSHLLQKLLSLLKNKWLVQSVSPMRLHHIIDFFRCTSCKHLAKERQIALDKRFDMITND